MAIVQGTFPLALLTLPLVREAGEAGAGVALLGPALDMVVWSNAPIRPLLGLPTGDAPIDAAVRLPENRPATRQIRAAVRLIETRGAASVMLRSATGLKVKTVTADLRAVDLDGERFVVLTCAALRAAASDDAALAERLLSEFGWPDATILDVQGGVLAGSSPPETVSAEEISNFVASGEPIGEIVTANSHSTLGRVASGLVLLRQEAIAPEPAVEEPVAPRLPLQVAKRRRPLSSRAASMNAILQRRQARRGEVSAPPAEDAGADEGEAQRGIEASSATEPSEGAGQDTPENPIREPALQDAPSDVPMEVVDDEGGTAAEPNAAEIPERVDAPATGVAAVSAAAASIAPRRHSAWGVPGVAAASPADSEITAAMPDGVADVGSSDASALPAVASVEEALGDLPDVADDESAPQVEPDEEMILPHQTDVSPEFEPLALEDEDGSEDAGLPARDSRDAETLAHEDDMPAETVMASPDAVDPDVSSDTSPVPQSPADGEDEGPRSRPDTPGEETAQPVEPETETILPDLPGVSPDFDHPIVEDEEKPEDEALQPRTLADAEAEAVLRGDDASAVVDGGGDLEEIDDGVSVDDQQIADAAELVPPDAPIAEEDAREEAGIPACEPDIVSGEPDGATPAAVPAFAPRFDSAPVRFVWQIDRDGMFRSLSDEFALAVGPVAADVLGRSFRDVAQVFGFDRGNEIARLLDRRDTWSGRTILWPVEGSDRKVPVDLAALPVYARDRSFEGFRGFGIVKMNEAVVDPDGVGLVLVAGTSPRPEAEGEPSVTEAAVEQTALAAPAVPAATSIQSIFRTFEAEMRNVAFGRRAEPPAPASPADDDMSVDTRRDAEDPDAPDAQKVIRLEERRRSKDGVLSQAEEAAFRAIGVKLGQHSEAESPGALRFAEEEAGGAPAAAEQVFEAASETVTADPSSPGDDTAMLAAGTADTDDVRETDEPDGSAEPEEPHAAIARTATGEAATGDAATGEVDADNRASAPAAFADIMTREASAIADAAGDAARAGTVNTAELEVAAEPQTAADMPGADAADLAAEADAPGMGATMDLDAIFGSLPLPILVQMQGRLVYANREFADLSGYADLGALEAEGGLDRLFTDPAEGQRSGELVIRRSNGQTAEVRVHMQRVGLSGVSHLVMAFSPSPRDSAAAANATEDADFAAAIRVTEDLQHQVEELQAVLDTATDGIVLLDTGGTIRAMNGSAHALFGIGQNEQIGRNLSSLFAVESQKAVLDYIELLRDEGMAGILNDGREVIGRVEQGGFIPLFITVGRLTGERGWCVVIRDIAHWKRIEEDLVNARRQAEAASLHKSRFLANISHELRTPLNAIIGFADVMASECFGPIGNERYLEYLGDIKRSGHHVLDLVNDLLDISKIEAGKLDLAFEAVSLNEVISEVVSLMQPQANRERVIVRSNLPASVPPVVADRRTIRQIALNLVANAIRFTPAGGQIIASTTYTAEGDVVLRFRDSGIGMTEREIEIALTPFQQVHEPSVTRGEGTGLGLPLTKAMVEANRALFSIASTPGEGTLIEISFPSQRVLAD